MIVCGDAQQNRTLWVKEFRKWAWRYPRLMFASIDVDVANCLGHSPHANKMREKLLGFEYVNGLSFNSIAPNGAPRAFNACNVETQQIFNKLTARYELACAQGDVPAFEKNGIESCLEIFPARALQNCIGQMNCCHLSHSLEFRLEDARFHALDDGQSEMPCLGFPIQNNLAISPAAQPPNFLLPLLPEQLRSLAWMVQQEAGSQVQGVFSHRECVSVPPFANMSSHWRMTADYSLSGGVLADSMGFGKTSCTLALIASQRKSSAAGAIGATLIVVPSHLLFQWHEEIKKFCCLKTPLNTDRSSCDGLHILTISSTDKIPDVETMSAADIVLVSVNLWESKVRSLFLFLLEWFKYVIFALTVSLQEYLQQFLDFSFSKDESKEQRAIGGTVLKDQAYVNPLLLPAAASLHFSSAGILRASNGLFQVGTNCKDRKARNYHSKRKQTMPHAVLNIDQLFAGTCGAALFLMKRTSSLANQTHRAVTYGPCHCVVCERTVAGLSLALLPCTIFTDLNWVLCC